MVGREEEAASSLKSDEEESRVCINDVLTDDDLRGILGKLESNEDRDSYGLVCKRWLYLQSTERKRLCFRAGTAMLEKMAKRFHRVVDLDISQDNYRYFPPGVRDSDLRIVAKGFSCLRFLNLAHCKGITDAGLVEIAKGFPNLRSLDVSDCVKLTDKGFTSLAEGCRHLKYLNLGNCKLVTDVSLHAFSKNCVQLEELVLHGCFKITDTGLSSLAKSCSHIKHLDISKCSNIGDAGIVNISSARGSSLKTFKLMDCSKIGDESIFSVSNSCKNLQTLVLSGCHNITDQSLMYLATALGGSLRNLSIYSCVNITDTAVHSIFVHCNHLEELDIGCCDKVTDASFLVFRSGLGPKLRSLKARSCTKITVVGIGILIGNCRSLRDLDVTSCPHLSQEMFDDVGLRTPRTCKITFTSKSLALIYR